MAEINVFCDGHRDARDCFRNLPLSSVVHYMNYFFLVLYVMSILENISTMLGNIANVLGGLMTTMGIVWDDCGIV